MRNDRIRMMRAKGIDMVDGVLQRIDDFHGNRRPQVFRSIVFFGCR